MREDILKKNMHTQLTTWKKNANIKKLPHPPPITFLMVRPLQGDKMFLNALDSGFIILDQGIELWSVENLPTVVNVACCTNLFQNDFSYKICQMPVQAETTASPVMVTNNDLHIFEEPCEVQNNISLN